MDFEGSFEKRVKKTIDDYGLINPGEKVLVACSGGKDSTTVLYALSDLGYDIEAMPDIRERLVNNMLEIIPDVKRNITRVANLKVFKRFI